MGPQVVSVGCATILNRFCADVFFISGASAIRGASCGKFDRNPME
ncbi:hypothetical protein VDG1235_2381 [Verrucomicrobiia bacterium DG1235]|nr:hypothetical protein VDG1235_2381 [Verrucomicrobiae bacterium DG1235]